jgi:2-polyprenyl-3-methyl-5-hydroxy-6-metoxy-1,4-benzoquinol methylase
MLRLTPDESWPDFWKESHSWDELELWGSRRDLGYSYQYHLRREWALRVLEELTPAGGVILDVAGSSGNFTLALAERGYHVVWNDLRPEMAELVKRKYEFGEIEYSPGNVFDFASDWTGRFDGVLAAEIIEHVAHPDQFLVCLAGMLKPGGRLFLTTPNGRYFRNGLPRFSECSDPSVFEAIQFKPNSDGHIFLLDASEILTLATDAGLEIEKLELMTNPLTRGHVKLGYLLPWMPSALIFAVERGTRKLPHVLRERVHCQMVAILRKPERIS